MTERLPTVALIDDDPGVTDGLRRGLRRISRNWNIVTYNDPASFIDKYGELEVDVIVSDMRMPQLSGLELIEKVHAIRPVPCIILTGSPDLTSSLYAINEISVFRYYTKPCDLDLLAEGITAALASNRAANVPPPVRHDLDASITTQLGLSALNRLALGVAVVDQDGYVRFSNQSAATIFSASDGLTLSSSGQVRASTPDITSTLLKSISQETNGKTSEEDDTNVLAIVRPSMARPYSVFFAPLEVDATAENPTTLTALFISDPDTIPLPVAEQIMKLYGLSRSQARIVQSLSAGMRLEEAADEAGVTVSTARTYLKQVFSKTDTARQSDLVRLVFTSPRVLAS